MKLWISRVLFALAAVVLLSGAGALSPDVASAEGKCEPSKVRKPKKSQGTYLGFDAASKTIKLREKGKELTYHVEPEGSVLTRTTVKINGQGAKLDELPTEARVIIYWGPLDGDKNGRCARSIDAPNIPDDLRDDFDNQ